MTGPLAAGETIVALSSGRPPAAIAVVRTSGPQAFEAAVQIAGSLGDARRVQLRTLRDPRDGVAIDQALVLSFLAPNTATGENIVEYQCHGGKAVVDALIGALTAMEGIRLAEPGEFTRRALFNGRIDLTQAEGLAELLQAETETQRKSALRRSEGALRHRIEAIRERLLALSAESEVAIDYADEEDGAAAFAGRGRLLALREEVSALLSTPRVEKLRDGVRVVVAGPPNAGKSSLVNALAGQERAIVTAIPGTTRDRIEVPLAIAGVPLVLVDTAGLRDSDDPIEQIGVGLAEQEVREADVLIWLGGEPAPAHPRRIVVTSKSDLGATGAGLSVSAVTGAGVDSLKLELAKSAAGLIPADGQIALTEREAGLFDQCRAALLRAAQVSQPLLVAEELRTARLALDRISGRVGVDEMLDALFGKFCLGK